MDSNFKLPDDGWYHLVPMGEYPVQVGKGDKVTTLVQVVDAAAVQQICNRFAAEAQRPNFTGLLVDFDHFSDDTNRPSRAAGWVTELTNRADGVWGRIRWSAAGNNALVSGEYRLASPVWNRRDCEVIGKDRVRPVRLDKVGLTNSPNMRGMAPLSNRESNEFRRGVVPAAGSETKTKDNKSMKSVATKLGLSAEASEDAVLDAVTKLMNRAVEAEQALVPLKNRLTSLETDNQSLLAAQVESDLDRLQNRFKADKREDWRKALEANRGQALALLEGLPEVSATAAPQQAAATGQVLNRATAQTPAAATVKPKKDELNTAVNDYKVKNRCSFEEAWEAVRREKPELFAKAQ